HGPRPCRTPAESTRRRTVRGRDDRHLGTTPHCCPVDRLRRIPTGTIGPRRGDRRGHIHSTDHQRYPQLGRRRTGIRGRHRQCPRPVPTPTVRARCVHLHDPAHVRRTQGVGAATHDCHT